MTDLREALEHILDGPPPTVVLAGPFAKALVDVAVAAEERQIASARALRYVTRVEEFAGLTWSRWTHEAMYAEAKAASRALDAALARLRAAGEP